MRLSSLYFLCFCILITFRDTLTQSLLDPSAKAALTPVVVLFVYCWTSTLLAWLFYAMRNKSWNAPRRWMLLEPRQRRTFLKLGVATAAVYGSTVWGIHYIGAPVFNVIDYAGMPLVTVLAGGLILKEDVLPRRIVFGVLGIVGVAILFLAAPAAGGSGESAASPSHWYLGIGLAVISTLATSYSSALQKKQLTKEKLYPDEVLLFRFPIPALIMTGWLFLDYAPVDVWSVLVLVVVAAVGVFLPLLLLCFGFMQASLGLFSRFLLLIPILTWIVVPVMIGGQRDRLMDWRIMMGAGLLLATFVLSELIDRSDS